MVAIDWHTVGYDKTSGKTSIRYTAAFIIDYHFAAGLQESRSKLRIAPYFTVIRLLHMRSSKSRKI